jgi:hypothetical protein
MSMNKRREAVATGAVAGAGFAAGGAKAAWMVAPWGELAPGLWLQPQLVITSVTPSANVFVS